MSYPRRFKTMALGLLFTGLNLSLLVAQSDVNLLKNADLSQGKGQEVPDWRFSTWNLEGKPALQDGIDWQLVDMEDGVRGLSIKAKNPLKAHVWWQQTLDVSGSGSYHLSVKAKATFDTKESRASLSVGIHFMDAAGEWLGYQSLPAASMTGDWEEVSGTIVVPEAAAKMGVRLGVDFEGVVDVVFKDVVLTAAE